MAYRFGFLAILLLQAFGGLSLPTPEGRQIIGGVPNTESPWHVFVGISKITDDVAGVPTYYQGVLINKDWVLTSAQIIPAEETPAGRAVITYKIEVGHGNDISTPVEAIAVTEKPEISTVTNNKLMLLRLSTSLVLEADQKTVLLPDEKTDVVADDTARTFQVTAIDIGNENKLKSLPINEVKTDTCKTKFTDDEEKELIDDNVVCGTAAATNCVDEIGSPLVIKIEENYVLIGILEKVNQEDTCNGMHSVFTRVLKQVAWINSVLNPTTVAPTEAPTTTAEPDSSNSLQAAGIVILFCVLLQAMFI